VKDDIDTSVGKSLNLPDPGERVPHPDTIDLGDKNPFIDAEKWLEDNTPEEDEAARLKAIEDMDTWPQLDTSDPGWDDEPEAMAENTKQTLETWQRIIS